MDRRTDRNYCDGSGGTYPFVKGALVHCHTCGRGLYLIRQGKTSFGTLPWHKKEAA